MLVYDPPSERTATRPSDQGRNGPSISASQIVLMLWRNWVLIVALGAIGATLALGFGELASPRYTSTTQLYIDPRDLRIVNRELSPVGQDANGYMTIVESQTRVITSRIVLDRVISAAKLDQDPEFVGRQEGILGSLMVRLGLRSALPAKASASAILETLEKRITIRRPERTFIVDVSVWASSPEKAALLANAVVDAYLIEDSEARVGAARRATSSLTSRLDELRSRVREAENRVEQYKSRYNLVGTRETLVSDQQLTEMNQQLGAARARTAQARARYDQMVSARQSGSIEGAMSEALASQTMATLRGQHAELRRRQAELTNSLGPLHPSVKSVDVQVRDLQRLIQQEIARFVESARNDLESARANEASLERSFEALKRRTLESGEAAVQLRELEREVEASRGVYEAFLVRARETGEQERVNATNARIITAASPPMHRSFPPRLSLLTLVGLFLGLALGAGLAFMREWMRNAMQSADPSSGYRASADVPPAAAPIVPRASYVPPTAPAPQAAPDDVIRWAREPKSGFPKPSFTQ